MKKLLKLLVALIFCLGLFSFAVVKADEVEQVEEQQVEEVKEDAVNEWFKEFFSAEKVAMYISWIAYIGTIIGLVAKVKQLKQSNNLTLKNVSDEVLGKIDGSVAKEVAERFEKYLPNILATQEKTNEIMSIFAKILALSQENTPESRIAILDLIGQLGIVGKEVVEASKEIVEETVQAIEEHKEEVNNNLDEIIKEYDGTSI